MHEIEVCDNHQGQFAIMFREDSQIDFAVENVLLNVSLRPYHCLSVCSILKPIIRLICVN